MPSSVNSSRLTRMRTWGKQGGGRGEHGALFRCMRVARAEKLMRGRRRSAAGVQAACRCCHAGERRTAAVLPGSTALPLPCWQRTGLYCLSGRAGRAHRIGHELVRHLQHLVRQRGRHKHHLHTNTNEGVSVGRGNTGRGLAPTWRQHTHARSHAAAALPQRQASMHSADQAGGDRSGKRNTRHCWARAGRRTRRPGSLSATSYGRWVGAPGSQAAGSGRCRRSAP